MWTWLSTLWNKFIGMFKAFISAVFSQSTQIIIGQLKDFAIEVVKELSLEDLTNTQRRNEAIKRIKEEALARGLEVRDSLVNLIVELAVQYWKNNPEA